MSSVLTYSFPPDKIQHKVQWDRKNYIDIWNNAFKCHASTLMLPRCSSKNIDLAELLRLTFGLWHGQEKFKFSMTYWFQGKLSETIDE